MATSALSSVKVRSHSERNKSVENCRRVCQAVYASCGAHTMKKAETPEQVKQWFLNAIRGLWPLAEGSQSLRKSPCIRENCPACARGEGHSSYVLYGRRGGKRFSIYVPDEVAPGIQVAVENGRRLKDLINEAGLRYAHAVKAQRDQTRRP